MNYFDRTKPFYLLKDSRQSDQSGQFEQLNRIEIVLKMKY